MQPLLSSGSISKAAAASLFGHRVRTVPQTARTAPQFLTGNACVVCRCAVRIGCSRTLVGMHTTSDGASPFSFRIENESRGSILVAAEHDRSGRSLTSQCMRSLNQTDRAIYANTQWRMPYDLQHGTSHNEANPSQQLVPTSSGLCKSWELRCSYGRDLCSLD